MAALDADKPIQLEADGRVVRITHPGRVLFPDIGATKLEVARYYLRVAGAILPHLEGRPLVLHRFPKGLGGDGFYQKRAPKSRPPWVPTATLTSPANPDPIEYVVGGSPATLLWMVNLGAWEMNPWLARADDPEHPTHLVVDLDPLGGEFQEVCEAALLVRQELEGCGLAPWAKTSGKRGMHVMASLPRRMTYPEVRELLAAVGRTLDSRQPERFALEERIRNRRGLIYFDSNQNGYGSTIAAPWSVRPTPTATISRPLSWEEVARCPAPTLFTIRTV